MKIRLLVLLAWLLSITTGAVATPLYLTDQVQEISTNSYTLVYVDNQNDKTLFDLLENPDLFIIPKSKDPNYGYSDNNIWLKLDVKNLARQTEQWMLSYLHAQNEALDIFLVKDNRLVNRFSFNKVQSRDFRNPAVPFNLEPQEDLTIIVRLSGEGRKIAPGQISTAKQHIRNMQIDSLYWGAFFGGLWILSLYGLWLYRSTKEISLLYYFGYISSVILWEAIWGGHLVVFLSSNLLDWLYLKTPD